MNVNNEDTRLERKAKRGWAAFFQSQNKDHEVHMRYVDKINILREKIADLSELKDIPVHILNELKELYEIAKKEISCPICLDVIEVNNIKFSNCGHKYCEGCLNTLKSQNPSKCAICRRRIY